MLRTIMAGTAPGAADPASEDEAKADDIHQAHEQVQPGTKERCSLCRTNTML